MDQSAANATSSAPVQVQDVLAGQNVGPNSGGEISETRSSSSSTGEEPQMDQSAANTTLSAQVQEVLGDQNGGLNGGGKSSVKPSSSGYLTDLSLNDFESSLGEPWL